MKVSIIILNIVASIAFLFAGGFAQSSDGSIKAISSPDPGFPVEARNFLYGDSVKVAVNIDKTGKVTATRVFGPMAPCSNLNDPVVTNMQKLAEAAAKKALFEPVLKDGKPIETGLMITYRLQPEGVPPTQEELRNRKTVINGGVINGRAISLPKPFFSESAKSSNATGKVEMSVLISEDGSVLSVTAVSGHPYLIEGTIEAACNARFKPTTLSGQPVKVKGTITYMFAR